MMRQSSVNRGASSDQRWGGFDQQKKRDNDPIIRPHHHPRCAFSYEMDQMRLLGVFLEVFGDRGERRTILLLHQAVVVRWCIIMSDCVVGDIPYFFEGRRASCWLLLVKSAFCSFSSVLFFVDFQNSLRGIRRS